MGNRGPKKNSQSTLNTFGRFIAILGRAVEFKYGLIPNKTRAEQNTAKRLAKDVLYSKSPTINTVYTETTIMARRKQYAEKTYGASWKRIKNFERKLGDFAISIGLVKSRAQAEKAYLDPIASSNKAILKLKKFADCPPTPEDAFYVLMKLDIQPNIVWPDPINRDLHLLGIMTKLHRMIVKQECVFYDNQELLRMAMIGNNGSAIDHCEWKRGLENFLAIIIRAFANSVGGMKNFYADHVDPEDGGREFVFDPNIAIAIEQENGKRVVTWREIESFFNNGT